MVSWEANPPDRTESNNLLQSAATAASQGFNLANLYSPESGTVSTIDQGATISCPSCTDINKDRLGIPRPQGSAWDIGAYEYQSAPTQTCASQGYQGCPSCASGPQPQYDTTCSGQVCCQSCSTSQYFLPEQYIEAENGILASPMQNGTNSSASGGKYIYTSTDEQGSATFTFQIQSPGKYRMEANVLSYGIPLDAHDSFYVGLDSEPAAGNGNYTYDTLGSSGFAWDNVSLRGPLGNFSWSQYDPKVWDLTAGLHNFTFYAREMNTWLDQIILRKFCIHKSDSNCDGCVDMAELNTFMDRWKINNLDVTLKEIIEAIGLWERGC